jgi:CRP-like cAMP-binding protein
MSKSPWAGPIIQDFASPWEEYLAYGTRREYRANTILRHSGEKAEGLIYVQKGEVLVSRYTMPEGLVLINIIRDKAMLGVSSFFTPVSPPSTMWRTLRSCVCYHFSPQYIRNECPRHLLLCLLEQLSFISSTMAHRFVQGGNRHNEARLARLLIHLATTCPTRSLPDGRGISITPFITQEITGDLIGLHPVTLNKLVAAFRAEGILGKFTKNNLEILNLPLLHARAGEGEAEPSLYADASKLP